MRGYVANTDFDWFTYLRAIEPPIDEVNFWKPGSGTNFAALVPGEPLFFKLKAPHNAVAGFGYFAHFSRLPVSMAWQVYGVANGARSYGEMRERLVRIRTRFDRNTDPKQDFWIGCILVNQPVFFDRRDWIRVPDDFKGPTVQGKTYDLTSGEGERLWLECRARATRRQHGGFVISDATIVSGYGAPMAVRPRLGQRSFRVVVLDTYGRRCAVTNEKTLPALEAAHIREYRDVQEHAVSNGILLRADIHKLFDAGYVTVTPDYHFEVSRRIKEEFENGRDYYALHGSPIRLPQDVQHRPSTDALIWHNEQRYLG
ncbi:MAG TPA: HNH endonuclease [Thermoanaerobaculia bacterium]|nr:HNH endonuclease [Thermoanaerobaculia bacterium]